MVSKKALMLKCSSCRQLLAAELFGHTAHVLQRGADRLVCVGCKRHCVQCGQHLPASAFRCGNNNTTSLSSPHRGYHKAHTHRVVDGEYSEDICDTCIAKRQSAQTNVFFRFPVLRYKACPFPVDKFREDIQLERRRTYSSDSSDGSHSDGSDDEVETGSSSHQKPFAPSRDATPLRR